jgi:chemosensory pili system protein ChpC
MSLLSEEVYCLLIPLRNERLIVPRSCVAEVIRDSLPETSAADGDWLCGRVLWNGRDIPVVSFERLCGESVATGGGRSRIVVFNSISDSTRSEPYGIVCEGFPQMVRVNAEVSEPDPGYVAAADVPVICRIRLINEQALIPALDELEARLRDVQVAHQVLEET